MADVLILIPARMAATRLPGKPLADIAGTPMIVHVLRRAEAARLGPVVVATDSPEIEAAVRARADRRYDTGRPRLRLGPHFRGAGQGRSGPARGYRRQCAGRSAGARSSRYRCRARPARRPGRRYRYARRRNPPAEERDDPASSRSWARPVAPRRLRALYFTRATAPCRGGPLYHHIGLYAFRRAALDRFVALPPSPLEQRENSSSCVRSRPACGSMSLWSTACRSVSIRRRIWRARAPC